MEPAGDRTSEHDAAASRYAEDRPRSAIGPGGDAQ